MYSLSLSASLLSCNLSSPLPVSLPPLPLVGFTISKKIILHCCIGAHRQEESWRKRKRLKTHWAADKTGQGQTGNEQEVESEINVSGLKQTDIREENGREITAEARNQVGWKTLEAIHSSHTPSIRKYNIERGLNWIKGRK